MNTHATQQFKTAMLKPEDPQAVSQFVVRDYRISKIPVFVDTTTPFFFILLEGEITVAYDSFPALTVRQGECLMVMRHSCYRMTVKRPSTGMRIMYADDLAEICHRYFGNLTDYLPKDFEYEFRALPAKPAVVNLLKSVRHVICDNASTPHMHSLWSELLISMMASYYKRQQIAGFLYPLIAEDYDFRHIVVEHSLQAKDLTELAALCHMSLSTLKRRFKQTFHSPAHAWIAARKAHFIYSEIINTNKTFVEIANDFDISSSAYLTAFCKQHFGITPQEIRRRGHESPMIAQDHAGS